jgi:sec-independent protein translocase protein TatC
MRVPGALRPRSIGFEDRLTTVGHLDELRARLIVCLLVLAVAFGLCFWQNHRLLHLINAPLAHQTQQQVRGSHGPLGATYALTQTTRDVSVQLRSALGVLEAQGVPPTSREVLSRARTNLARDISRLTVPPGGDRPVTLGIGEPFTTTVTVSLIFSLIVALPFLLAQACGFLGPALAPEQRRHMRILLAAVPALFVTGVVFGYEIVLPAAVHFLQNFNSDEFSVLVQASQYYKFAAMTLLSMGLLFQVPVAILVVTQAGVVSARQLRRKRRYAVVACAVLAGLLPGDATTMLLEALPVYFLFEISVAVAALVERQGRAAGAPETA